MAKNSGVGVYLRNLLPLCMARLPEVRFLLLGPRAVEECFVIPAGTQFEPVAANIPIYSVKEQLVLPWKIAQADALWTPHYNIPVFTGKPLLATVHDVAHLALTTLYSGLKRAYARTLFAAVARKADELIFVSDFSRREFLRLVGQPRGRANVILNGVSQTWFEEIHDESPVPFPYCVAIGNIKEHKNIRRLCQAWRLVAATRPEHLVLIGKKSGFSTGEVSVQDLEAACPGRIHITGLLDEAPLRRHMRHAQALVFPSLYEGFGLPTIEALAMGTPVAASNIPPVREACGESAFYFSPQDPSDMARTVTALLELDGPARKALVDQGRTRARLCSWNESADKTAEALARVLAL